MDNWKNYLSTLDTAKQHAVMTVMKIAAKHIPNPKKVMSYGVPTIKSGDKSIIAVAANNNHFSIYPFGGAAIEANMNLLKNAEFTKGTIKFKYNHLPNEEIIYALIKYNLIHK